MIPQINKYQLVFPDPNEANEEGLLAWGGDLSSKRLIQAYKSGIFPWYSKFDPILWFSPNPRLIMQLEDFKISKSLKKSLKKFTYKFDSNFTNVIHNCANKQRKGQNDTWIQQDIIKAYTELHETGVAHSIEAYYEDQLVGGLYGLSIGKVFCGESMFANKSDSSKAAYTILVQHLKQWNYHFIDCQTPTTHLKTLGAKEVSREYFLKRLDKANKEYKLAKDKKIKWEIDKELIRKVLE